LSMGAWIKPNAFGRTILSKGTAADTAWTLSVGILGSVSFQVFQDGSGTGFTAGTNILMVGTGAWRHVAGTFDAARRQHGSTSMGSSSPWFGAARRLPSSTATGRFALARAWAPTARSPAPGTA